MKRGPITENSLLCLSSLLQWNCSSLQIIVAQTLVVVTVVFCDSCLSFFADIDVVVLAAVSKPAGGALMVDIQIEPPTPQQTMIGGFKGHKPQKSASHRGAGSTIQSGNISYVDFIHTTNVFKLTLLTVSDIRVILASSCCVISNPNQPANVFLECRPNHSWLLLHVLCKAISFLPHQIGSFQVLWQTRNSKQYDYGFPRLTYMAKRILHGFVSISKCLYFHLNFLITQRV